LEGKLKEVKMYYNEIQRLEQKKEFDQCRFLLAEYHLSKASNLKVAIYLYETAKHKGYKMNVHEHISFKNECKWGKLEKVKWLYELSKFDGHDTIDIRRNDDYLFLRARVNLPVLMWLTQIEPSYELVLAEPNEREAFVERRIITVLPPPIEYAPVDMDDRTCAICLEEDEIDWIRLQCKHKMCAICYKQIKRCPYRCDANINENVTPLTMIRR
jgi:hypothetical protein